jgi:hypothetical protein
MTERPSYSPVMYDLESMPAAELDTVCAHAGCLSPRGATAPWLWLLSSAFFAARLTSGALGTPDASVRTVGGSVTAFFTAWSVAIEEADVGKE